MNFIIDKSKWRCGFNGPQGKNALGEGETFLLNEKGFMCCLGQCMKQEGIQEKYLINIERPEDIIFSSIFKIDKELTDEAIFINDNQFLKIQDKIDRLTQLFNMHGHQIEFV